MFNERLRSLRKSKRLTMKDLAKLIDLSEPTISGYESGTRKPDIDTLNRLADIFNVSVDYLLGRSNKKNKDYGELQSLAERVLKEDKIEQFLHQHREELGIGLEGLEIADFLKSTYSENVLSTPIIRKYSDFEMYFMMYSTTPNSQLIKYSSNEEFLMNLEFCYIDPLYVKGHECFYIIEVPDNSFSPTLEEEDHVLVAEIESGKDSITNGDIVLIGEAKQEHFEFVRFFKEKNTIILQDLKTNEPRIQNKKINIFGKVIQVIKNNNFKK